MPNIEELHLKDEVENSEVLPQSSLVFSHYCFGWYKSAHSAVFCNVVKFSKKNVKKSTLMNKRGGFFIYLNLFLSLFAPLKRERERR